ncbi:uncharacterized protein LAJ45_05866 [Morchella importuna]|uniref:uncharacterized protein n=1 Tax=Morchella importuna TaxID=1174673 RepID=UPI001E8D671A|nr:uncharacterized protein LAJ45_05866 [Morchella importuna]KAH8150180.1 hypothetical protein LAJ45_05866 [Morchella importuna]
MSHVHPLYLIGPAPCLMQTRGRPIALLAAELAYEIDSLLDLSKNVHLDVPDDISEQSNAPKKVDLLDVCVLEKSNICYKSKLLSWDLLSESLCPKNTINPVLEQLNRSSSEDDQQPGGTITVPSVLEYQFTPQAQACCDGNCNGGLIGPHACKRDGKALRITCRSKSCTAGFTTKHGFNRHCQSVHKLGKPIDCEVPGCNEVFTRKVNMIQHLRTVHEAYVPIKKYRMKGQARGYGH